MPDPKDLMPVDFCGWVHLHAPWQWGVVSPPRLIKDLPHTIIPLRWYLFKTGNWDSVIIFCLFLDDLWRPILQHHCLHQPVWALLGSAPGQTKLMAVPVPGSIPNIYPLQKMHLSFLLLRKFCHGFPLD